MLRAYSAFSSDAGAREGAVLVFASTAREARRMAWGRCLNVDEWIDQAVRWIRGADIMLLAEEDGKHVVEQPLCCESCGLWNAGLDDDDLCGECGQFPGAVLIGRLRS